MTNPTIVLFGGPLRRLPVNGSGELVVDTTSDLARLRDECHDMIRRYGYGTDHHKRASMRRLVDSRTTLEDLRQVRALIRKETRRR